MSALPSVNYLLEDASLFGGVKVVLHHATLLHAAGHPVRVVSLGEKPTWVDLDVEYRRVTSFETGEMPEADVNVATFWTTIDRVARLGFGMPVHYCQGFEASYTHNQQDHPTILNAYSTPIPAFAVSPHLVEMMQDRFKRPARLVRPALEPIWKPAWRFWRSRTPRLLVVGPFENPWKGVRTALDAVRLLRQRGIQLKLIRLSQWPLSDEERDLVEPDEFHCHVTPKRAARITAGCDLLLAPSWEQEGFGLPVLETMGSGVPVVASNIAAFSGYAGEAARLVQWNDPEAFADAAEEVLGERRVWKSMRDSGLECAGGFIENRVLKQLEEAIRWAAAGDWN